MLSKRISIFLSLLIAAAMLCCGFSAFADSEAADTSALSAALGRVESYEAGDYTPESYQALADAVSDGNDCLNNGGTQAEIDGATSALLEAISGLRAYLKLNVTTTYDIGVSVAYGEVTGGAGKYTATYGDAVTLTAPAEEGYIFAGWFETVSKRMLSTERVYAFTMTVNASLRATYYKDASAVLSFESVSGQIFAAYEKTAAEWAQYESLDSLAPESVPYRYGYTNGSWNIPSDALTKLANGENVTVTPTYVETGAREWSAPETKENTINLKLHYRYDGDKDVGSFVLNSAVSDGIEPLSYGMLFYYKKADSFNPVSFDVNINNKMLASQYSTADKDKYITNMKKISFFFWAVRGYAVYEADGKKITVYSNQVNVVDTEDIHDLVDIEAVASTCTESGNTAGTYCDICGEYFGVEETPALEHNYEAVVTDATCTEGGYTTYTCSRCGDSYIADETAALGHSFGDWVQTTDPTCTEAGVETRTCQRCGAAETRAVAALGHNYEAVVTDATCTEGGYTTYTCSRCGDSYVADETAALGHSFGDWVQTTDPTCTEAGVETRTCQRCGEAETRSVAALGHNYEAVVTDATCTEGGYTTYTCSRCGDSYVADETAALGHSFGDWSVTAAPTAETAGTKTRTCSRCGETETQEIPALNIVVKLPNVSSYLYRAGTSNNIALSSLFKAYDESIAIDSSKVSVTVANVAGTAAGTYTANTSDWSAGTVKLTGTGVVKLTVKNDGYTSCELYLEAVAGTNYAAGATLGTISSSNAILLGDVNASACTISNAKTVYGNGFSITDTRTSFAGAANCYIRMSGGASIDNAKLLGTVYPSAVTSGQENQYYAPGVWIIGDANIYNSYVSETKNAVQIDSGTVYFENTTFAGGAIANIDIGGGDVTLKNCVTSSSDRGGLKGLGIRPKTASCKIHLLGTFTQYNYLTSSDLPSSYKSILNSIYSNSTYAYTYGGSTYLNMGIFFVTETGSITEAQASAAIDDQTGNNYGFIEKTVTGLTGTVYTLKSASATPSLLTSPVYDETVNGQYPISPAYTFDYTTKNYIAKTADSNLYCYYDSTTKDVQISFDKENSSSLFTWDPMILTVTKNGNTLPYTVSMDGTNYTNGTISFTESGDYQVEYTYIDPYNYTLGGATFSKTYTKTVNISVTAVEPDTSVYNASFVYDGAAGNYAAKKVIGTDSKTYIMPDVSSTSSTIGSTTVAGQTVYYPIVTVNPTSSNGNSSYSSGKGYYFAPVFSELHIIDYNQETGAQQYEYSKSTSTWPHGNAASSGPNTAYFTCASGEKVWSGTSPYARSMNSQYYKYGKNNLGVCYTSTEIEKDNSASTHLVQYHYVSNDGTTYYYYIQYKFGAMTYSSCVTEGTLVTMGDGTYKPIEDVKVGDMVMTWSMWKGCYEAQPVALHWYHGTDEWQVLTLKFSDGTEVRTINEHGFFDTDKNAYAYIRTDNVDEYVGDRFIKQKADGTNTAVTLTDYEITHETVGSYSIQTAYNESFMVEDMLSMTGEDFEGRFEYFDIGEGMKYDEEKMQEDIAKYGLYTYEEFSDYLTPEQFEMFNGAYFKVLVGKGVFTYEQIFEIIGANL